jgi:hypothetical protein
MSAKVGPRTKNEEPEPMLMVSGDSVNAVDWENPKRKTPVEPEGC